MLQFEHIAPRAPMRLVRTLPLGVCLACAVWCGTAAALPVRVQAKTQFEATLETQADGLAIRATLLDDRRRPIPSQAITATLPNGLTLSGTTNSNGRVTWQLPAPALEELRETTSETLQIELGFGGSAALGSASSRRAFDIRRDTIRLDAVLSPARVEVRQRPRVLAAARFGRAPLVGAPLTATLGDHTSTVRTGGDGRAVFRGLPALDPGRHLVRISYPGNLRFEPQVVTRPLLVMLRPSLRINTLKVDASAPALELDAIVMDDDGRPVTAPLELVVGERVIGTLQVTDGRVTGAYDLTNEATRFGPRAADARLVLKPQAPWVVPLDHGFVLDVPPPPRVSPFWYALLVGGAAFVLLLSAGRTTQGLLDWWRNLRRPAPASAARRPPVAVPESAPIPPKPGRVVFVVRSVLVPTATLRAEIVLEHPTAPSRTVRQEGEPPVRVDGLAPGVWRAVITADGFEPLSLEFDPTTRQRVIAELAPIRLAVREAFSSLVGGVAPDWAFGAQSARDGLPHLTTVASADLARRLVNTFEALYHGGDRWVTGERRDEVLALMREFRAAEREVQG